MRVLVTGSRDWPDVELVLATLAGVANEFGVTGTVVHGGRGRVDTTAHRWALRNGWGTEVHAADWRQYGRAAGPIRNRAMVTAGADLCLVFIGPCSRPACRHLRVHGSHGASGCAELAQAAGIETRRYEH